MEEKAKPFLLSTKSLIAHQIENEVIFYNNILPFCEIHLFHQTSSVRDIVRPQQDTQVGILLARISFSQRSDTFSDLL